MFPFDRCDRRGGVFFSGGSRGGSIVQASHIGARSATPINGAVAPDEAHDPINKDKALQQRYAALRAGAAPR
jgi:hypothetical protein